jgi:hypothetical protein
MKNSTLIVLGLIGIGLYLYLKKQSVPVVDLATNLPPATPSSSLINTDPYLINVKKTLGKIPNTI